MKTLATASWTDDQIASYSSKGPTLLDHIVKPDLVGPGNRTIAVRSAGAVAILPQKTTSLTPDQVKA